MGGMTLLGGALMAKDVMAIAQGISQGEASKLEAKQVGMEAQSQELARRAELQDALAMQAVIAGAGGREAGEGSLQAIRQADIGKARQDISLIKSGAQAEQASIKAAGRAQRFSTIAGGLMSTGMMASKVSQIGGAAKGGNSSISWHKPTHSDVGF